MKFTMSAAWSAAVVLLSMSLGTSTASAKNAKDTCSSPRVLEAAGWGVPGKAPDGGRIRISGLLKHSGGEPSWGGGSFVSRWPYKSIEITKKGFYDSHATVCVIAVPKLHYPRSPKMRNICKEAKAIHTKLRVGQVCQSYSVSHKWMINQGTPGKSEITHFDMGVVVHAEQVLIPGSWTAAAQNMVLRSKNPSSTDLIKSLNDATKHLKTSLAKRDNWGPFQEGALTFKKYIKDPKHYFLRTVLVLRDVGFPGAPPSTFRWRLSGTKGWQNNY